MARLSCLVLLSTITSATCLPARDKTDKPNSTGRIRPIEELVTSRGYPFEALTVVTEDDYILTLHRIKHGRRGQKANKTPVLVQHGIMDSSANFMAASKGMAYHLADAGFDVWLGNARGSTYSRKHASKDPDTDKSFWDFSFHEMGLFDLPANIKKIQEVTGSDKLHYVGLSMASTQLLVLASTHPEWALERLDKIILVGPVAMPKHSAAFSSWINKKLLSAFVTMMRRYGFEELFKYREVPAATVHRLCAPANSWTRRLCEPLVKWVMSSQRKLHDFDNSVDVLPYMPAGFSLKTCAHFLQMAKAESFQQFDYQKDNKDHYEGKTSPPKYELSKITKRLHMICGGADKISTMKDNEWLKEQLPDAVLHTDGFQDFIHHDFLYRVNLDNTLYKTMDEILKQEQ